MKKAVIKISVLSLILLGMVSCRDDNHYSLIQSIETKNQQGVSMGNGIVSFDGKILLKWYNTNLTEIDMERHITLKNIKIINEYVFNFHKNITKVILPNQLEEIKNNAFSNTSITSITIPKNVKKIGDYAFGNTKLTEVKFSSTHLKEIEKTAFRNNLLTSIEIPEGVEKIGNGAFENNRLNTVILPSTIKEIGNYALYGGTIKTITINATTPPNIDVYTFNIYSYPTIYVPKESVQAYKTAKNWKNFAQYIVAQEK